MWSRSWYGCSASVAFARRTVFHSHPPRQVGELRNERPQNSTLNTALEIASVRGWYPIVCQLCKCACYCVLGCAAYDAPISNFSTPRC